MKNCASVFNGETGIRSVLERYFKMLNRNLIGYVECCRVDAGESGFDVSGKFPDLNIVGYGQTIEVTMKQKMAFFTGWFQKLNGVQNGDLL